MADLITARTGNESHSSTWGKFVAVGIMLVVEDKTATKHSFYRDSAFEVTEETPPTIFTIWAADGNKRGTDEADFYICQVAMGEHNRIEGGHRGGGAYIEGPFVILAHGDGKVRAPRLLQWWNEWAKTNGGQTAEMARHLAEQIKHRGKAIPDPLPAVKTYTGGWA